MEEVLLVLLLLLFHGLVLELVGFISELTQSQACKLAARTAAVQLLISKGIERLQALVLAQAIPRRHLHVLRDRLSWDRDRVQDVLRARVYN